MKLKTRKKPRSAKRGEDYFLRRKTLRLSEKFACPVGCAILLAASPDLPAFLPMF